MGTTWIRTNPKKDLGCSTTEMVYDTPLTVPGDFATGQNKRPDTNKHIQQLHSQVESWLPAPTLRHGRARTAMPKPVMCAKFVFIHKVSHHSLLQHLCRSPFRVIEQGTTTFQIFLTEKHWTISINCLKEAYIDKDELPKVVAQRHDNPSNLQPMQALTPNLHPAKVQGTFSERQIRFPLRYTVSRFSGRSGVPPTTWDYTSVRTGLFTCGCVCYYNIYKHLCVSESAVFCLCFHHWLCCVVISGLPYFAKRHSIPLLELNPIATNIVHEAAVPWTFSLSQLWLVSGLAN